MNRYPILFLFVLVGFSGLPFGCNPLPMETITDMENSYDGITKVNVNGGSLEISYIGGEDRKAVNIEAFVEASDTEMEGVIVRRVGDELNVNFESGSNGSFFSAINVEGYISLTGPVDMAVNINNSSGTLEVINVTNDDIVLNGSSGKIVGRNLKSPDLKVKISSGKLELKNIEGGLNMEVSSGMGTLEGMKGDVKFKGSSGMVVLSNIDGLLSGSMSSGKADLNRVSRLGEISLSSGMLEASKCGIGAETNLSASSGYMTVNTTSSLKNFNFDFKVGSGRLNIGDQSSSDDMYVNNDADVTIKGRIQSGKMVISE
ncbi:DUF4097 family beta strand repeat-containing protein [Cyclobacterium qasimii]|nr:DUF4097 family beta strand repeat-containing protein [Cyclobacterium qasimii]